MPEHADRSGPLASARHLQVLLAGSESEWMSLCRAWLGRAIDVSCCEHLAAALVMVGKSAPDLVIVGEFSGPLDPFEFLGALRQVDSSTTVVVGLDREQTDLEADALAAGASAVVRRPLEPAELLGLLHPGLGRDGTFGSAAGPLDLGRLLVDVAPPRIWLDGIEVLLPHMEFRLLRHLAEHQGEIVPRAELESVAWVDGAAARSNSLSVHIARLRRRLQSGFGTEWICSVRGFGYRLIVPARVD